MRRLFTSIGNPTAGAVYRDFSGCGEGSSGAPCGQCVDQDIVSVISGPGCTTFPVSDNEYGRLPTSFPGDIEIDTYGYEPLFEQLSIPFPATDPDCPNTPQYLDYPDLWSLIGDIDQALQDDVLHDSCYCLGDGVDRQTLSFGRPQFPSVNTLPFFTFPNFSFSASTLTVRQFNPDGPPVTGDCCPGSEDFPEHIEAEVVGNELRLTRRKRADDDYKEIYRADDTDPAFQIVAGYPRNCCMTDPCPEGSSGEESFVKRNLHFPRWPGPNSMVSNIDYDGASQYRTARDPYGAESDKEEPLGIIPRVVDIQCGEDGRLYVYWANDIIHDGHIAGVQWNSGPPRSDSGSWNAMEPPLPPEELPVNEDYQGNDIFSDFTPLGDMCDNNCLEAAVQMAKTEEACSPACLAEDIMCQGDSYQIISLGQGATEEDSISAAFDTAMHVDTPEGCHEGAEAELYWLCYTKWNSGTSMYESAVAFCCMNQGSS